MTVVVFDMPSAFVFLDMSPSRSISNLVNESRTHVKQSCNRVWRISIRKRFSDVLNLICRKFAVRVVFTTKIDKPVTPLQFRVSSQRNPFQIFGPVICLNAIDVVDR